MWRMLLACAWTCDADLPELVRVLYELVPRVLPCPTCRAHYAEALPRVKQRARHAPRTKDEAFRWIWYMKDEVNKHTKTPSIHFADLVDRYVLHGGAVDEVETADVLTLMALAARAEDADDAHVAWCAFLAAQLPLAADSTLRHYLAHVTRPIVATTLRCARHTRESHGLRVLPLAHYRAAAAP